MGSKRSPLGNVAWGAHGVQKELTVAAVFFDDLEIPRGAHAAVFHDHLVHFRLFSRRFVCFHGHFSGYYIYGQYLSSHFLGMPIPHPLLGEGGRSSPFW